MLFTFNPMFQTEEELKMSGDGRRRALTAKKKDILAQKSVAQKKFGIDDIQMNYIHGKSSKYCKESSDIVRIFFQKYKEKIPSNSVVFHDSGSAFSRVTEEIKTAGNVEIFVVYPPCVHELLSPNDNNLHGACKQVWRNEENISENDLFSTLYLLFLLSDYSSDLIRSHFIQNFGLSDGANIDEEWCRRQVSIGKNVKTEKMDRFHYCWNLYKEYVKNPYELYTSQDSEMSSSLCDGLDGDYWTLFDREGQS